MGIFVDYPVNPFSKLTSISTVILETGSGVNLHPLQVNSIIICNRGAADIRFNLQRQRTGDNPVLTFLVNQFEIKGYQTVDIIERLGLQIFLEYSTSPNPVIIDSLICFSNGKTQEFDCEVNYTRLNDLPLT
jgi:hypothetical protein